MIIDIHTHTFCPEVVGKVAGTIGPDSVPYQRDMSPESRAREDEVKPDLAVKFNNLDRRRADMAAAGIDFQAVATAPGLQHYWAAPALLAEISRMQNDHVAALVAQSPDTMAAIGTLPLTDTDASVEEIARAKSLGIRAFQIDSRCLERELSHPSLDPIYGALERHGLGLMIHPLGFSHGQRLSPYFMINSIAQPLEEVIAFQHLIFGGVMDRHPDLRVYIAHGGGYAPFYIGRLDHAWKARPEVNRLLPAAPSTYLPRFYYDTCVFRPDHIETLVGLVGADRVMLGSDYPFDMSDPDPVGTLDATSLSAADKDLIKSTVARRFLELEPD
ncbi:MAG: amidohydrolase family protein [Pseudomonadota bacterium]